MDFDMRTGIAAKLSFTKFQQVSRPIVSLLIALISAASMAGWLFGYGKLSDAVRLSVPMHPTTAILLLAAAESLWLYGRTQSGLKSHAGKALAATVFLGGLVRLSVVLLGMGAATDPLLTPAAIVVNSGLRSLRFTMAPATSSGLMFLGAALFYLYHRAGQNRWLVYTLSLIPALIALLALSKCLFVNLAPQSSGLPIFPIAVSAAVAFILMFCGIALQLSVDTTAKTSEDADCASLANQLAVGFGTAVFLLCGVGIFCYQSIAEFIDDSHWDNHTYQVLSAIDQLGADLKEADEAQRGYALTANPTFLKPLQLATHAIGPSLQNLQQLAADNLFHQQQLKLLTPLIHQQLNAAQLIDPINLILNKMSAEENKLLAKRLAETQRNAHRGIVLISLSALFALMMVVGAGWVLYRDIGRRESAERKLRASERLFRGLLQSAPDAIVITDESGKIELINAKVCELFGYTAEQLEGQYIDKIIPDALVEPTLSAKTDRPDGDLIGIRKDSSIFSVEITHSPMKSADGMRVSSAIRDITRQQDEELRLEYLNAALGDSNAQLEATNKELESFSYSVSHDLRAPLRSIDGFSQAILEDYSDKLDEEGQDHLRRVRAATQRMGQLIDDLLNLSRVSRVEMNKEQVDLSRIIRDIADELRVATPDHNVDFVVPDNVVAYTDARLIRIVLTNLLNNAWKFTAKRQRAQIEFGCTGENGKTEYFVRDNGAGFDPAYSSRLFGAFQRLHSAADYAGTGIGLATVQRIVRRQGGSIWAEGQLDKGATFHFTL